jgi:hypothetical protein
VWFTSIFGGELGDEGSMKMIISKESGVAGKGQLFFHVLVLVTPKKNHLLIL